MDEKTFTQDEVNKLVGDARVKARAKAESDASDKAAKDRETAEQAALVAKQEWQTLADQRKERISELEPLEAQVKAYEDLVAGMLKDQVKEHGEAAQKAVGALPESMTAIEKLAWLNKNIDLFKATTGGGVGTPSIPTRSRTSEKDEPRRVTSL